mgnify:CR=1 FL=1
MNDKDSRLLWERGLQFLGGQTAAQSHEVTNVFNIINELAGLLGDLVYGLKHGRDVDPERFREIADKIAFQVQRGNTIVRTINQFGHSADTLRALIDLRTVLERICFIAQRPANLSKTRLETAFPEDTVALENSPLGLEQAVFTAFEIGLAASDTERHMTISYALPGDGVEITVHSADPLTETAEAAAKAAFLVLLLDALGGRFVDAPFDGDPHRIVMHFPAVAPPDDGAV